MTDETHLIPVGPFTIEEDILIKKKLVEKGWLCYSKRGDTLEVGKAFRALFLAMAEGKASKDTWDRIK